MEVGYISEPEKDVVIVGGGPAGLFAALELGFHSDLNVLLLEKGKEIENRRCIVLERGGVCPPCSPCYLTCGLGGAGAFSDGKLTLSPNIGGMLSQYLGREELSKLIKYVDGLYIKFGADQKVYGVGEEVERIARKASLAELKLMPFTLRHLGTENCRQILKKLVSTLSSSIKIRLGSEVKSVLVDGGRVVGVEVEGGERIGAKYVILAPGREGSDWLGRQASRLGLTIFQNPIDLGVRVEVPAVVMEEITSALYEAKLEFFSKSFDDRIRTFCMCPYGEVTMETTGGQDPVITVNGHSYANRRTSNTNFALLVSTTFTEPFKDPIGYGRSLARLANLISGGVLVQRLGDLLEGRRTTPSRLQRGIVEPTLKGATPGDLSYVIPYRFLKGIVEMLEAMDKLSPGIASRHTLLYGAEVKFYSCRLKHSPSLETEIENLFACGDGAGITRGLMQASLSGIIAAREILRREGKFSWH